MQRINGHKTQKSDILENQTGLGQSKKLTSQWRQKKTRGMDAQDNSSGNKFSFLSQHLTKNLPGNSHLIISDGENKHNKAKSTDEENSFVNINAAMDTWKGMEIDENNFDPIMK